jgi:hypothetical protein
MAGTNILQAMKRRCFPGASLGVAIGAALPLAPGASPDTEHKNSKLPVRARGKEAGGFLTPSAMAQTARFPARNEREELIPPKSERKYQK